MIDLPSAHAHTGLRFAVGQTTLGRVLVARSAQGIRALLIADDDTALRQDLSDRFSKCDLVADHKACEGLLATAITLIEAPWSAATTRNNLALDPVGTPFQQTVWRALREIPAGLTASYADVARQIGQPSAARAVALACAANPLAVVIPCHRVLRINGTLSGYRWGIARKRELLDRESRWAAAQHAR